MTGNQEESLSPCRLLFPYGYRVVRFACYQAATIVGTTPALKRLHMFIIQEGCVVKSKLFTLFDVAKGYDIQAFVRRIGLTTVILGSPAGRVIVPQQKYFIADRICVAAEDFFFILAPVFLHVAAGHQALGLLFPFENQLISG